MKLGDDDDNDDNDEIVVINVNGPYIDEPRQRKKACKRNISVIANSSKKFISFSKRLLVGEKKFIQA